MLVKVCVLVCAWCGGVGCWQAASNQPWFSTVMMLLTIVISMYHVRCCKLLHSNQQPVRVVQAIRKLLGTVEEGFDDAFAVG